MEIEDRITKVKGFAPSFIGAQITDIYPDPNPDYTRVRVRKLTGDFDTIHTKQITGYVTPNGWARACQKFGIGELVVRAIQDAEARAETAAAEIRAEVWR